VGARDRQDSAAWCHNGLMAEQVEAEQNERQLRRVSLQPGESVVLLAHPSRAVTWPKYLYTLGLYGIWRKRQTYILTNRRILLSRGVFARSERSVPMDRVDDASFLRRGLAAYSEVVVSGRGPRRIERIGPLSARTARRFTREVQART
jgi:PH (Pleckstrin Homology) domain-containing protein